MNIFQCKKCGDCCNGYGGTYVTESDIQNIAAFIETDSDEFIQKYCVRSGKKYVLAQADNGVCIFWNQLCTIHPVKPRMCKAWPFIESVLIDPSNWAIMGNSCPGINTDAPIENVRETIKQEIANNP